MKKHCEDLPPIDQVQIVDLTDIDVDNVGQYMEAVQDASYVTLNGDAAQQVARLWRSLPTGHQSRCHLPPVGLRFLNQEQILCEASICFKCDNIFGQFQGADFHAEFDSTHPISQELKTICLKACEQLQHNSLPHL